ncbi:helix-turn-helix domain-containing protein [Shigella flexneri]
MEVLEQQEGDRTRTALMLGISSRALMYKPGIRYQSGGCMTQKLAMQKFAQCAIFS